MSSRLRIPLFLLAVAAGHLGAQTPHCADATITGDRVGAIHMGMPLDSVRRVCSIIRDTTEYAEGELVRVIYVLVAGDTVHLDVTGDSVDGIAVDTRTFATRDSRTSTEADRADLPRSTVIDEILMNGSANRAGSDGCP